MDMLCVPIIAENTDEALKKIARANKTADMLELREKIFQKKPHPRSSYPDIC